MRTQKNRNEECCGEESQRLVEETAGEGVGNHLAHSIVARMG
jgi:hypothetical protein